MKRAFIKKVGIACLAFATTLSALGGFASLNKSISAQASEATTHTENLATATNATVTASDDGYFVDSTAGVAYSGEIPYVWKGDTAVTFEFPNDRANGWKDNDGYTLNFVYDIQDTNGASVFQVVYKSTHHSTVAYVKYGDEVRTFTYYLNNDPWYNANGFYAYGIPNFNEAYYAPYMFNNKNNNIGAGTMEIKIVDDVVQIWATHIEGKDEGWGKAQKMIAAFDGSDAGFTKPEAKFVKTEDSPVWGLPKIYNKIKDGYKIAFSSTNVSNTNDQVDVDWKIKSVVGTKVTPAAPMLTYTENLAVATNATVTAGDDGYFVDSTAGVAYNGKIPYAIKGSSAVTFEFPNDRANGWKDNDGYTLNFVYDIQNLNGASVFQVVYKSTHHSTVVYVKYGDEVRTFTYYLNNDPWYNANGFYVYGVPNFNEAYYAPYMFNNKNNNIGAGTMEIKIVDDVVQIWATYVWGKDDGGSERQVLVAAFDGSSAGFVKPEAKFVKTENSPVWGLPKIYNQIKDGYKITFSSTNVSNTNDQVDVDWKIKSLQAQNATLNAKKVIAIDATASFENCAIGDKIVIPAASWTSEISTTPTAITSAKVVSPSGQVEVAVGGTYSIQEEGAHKIVYSVDGESAYIEFTAIDKSVIITENLATAKNATVTSGDGYLVDSTAGVAYSGEIPYILKGNSAINFEFPNDRANGWKETDGYTLNFVYDIQDLNGASVFQVVYKSTHHSTVVYVKYGDEVRTFTYYLNNDPWYNANGFYVYGVPNFNEAYYAPYMFNNKNNNIGAGTMEIKIVDDVVQIWATYVWGKDDGGSERQVLVAAFDGSSAGFVKPEAKFVKTENSPVWGLPKIYNQIKDGYKITFSSTNVSNTNDQVDVDWKINSIKAQEATFDTRKVIAIDYTENYNNCGIGFEIVIPAASWTTEFSTTPTAITTARVVSPSGEVEVAVDGTYVIQETGVHKIVYTVDGDSKYIEFIAQETTISVLDKFHATGATPTFINTEKDKGVLISSNEPYSVDLEGIFFGSTAIDFRFTETNTNYIGGFFAITITDALDESKSFQIEYSIVCSWDQDGYTGAHLRYGNTYRSSRYWGTEWYDSRKTGDETTYCGPSLLNDRGDRDGKLAIEIDANGVIHVLVSSFRDDSMREIGAFDGTDTFVSGTSWGLPKLSFENGYKISFSSSFSNEATEDKASDVCVKAITTNGATVNFNEKYLKGNYSFRVEFEDIAQDGENIWVPNGETLGKANAIYSLVVGGSEWIQKIVPITVNADTSTVGTTTLNVTDNSYASAWKEVTKAYTMNVETKYTLTFDTNGGTAIAPITHSEHSTDRVAIGTTERIGMEFDGWYIGEEKFDGDVTKLYGKNVTLVANWKDVTPPVISLANGVSDLTEALEKTTVVISAADVKAEDAAQNDTVVITIEVKVPNGEFVTVQSGYSLMLNVAGVYTIRYTATDGAGLTAQVTREIRALERAVPTLTVTANGQTEVFVGEMVTLATVTAKDADGADVNVVVTVTANGNVITVVDGAFYAETAGEYTITYIAKDVYDLIGMHVYTVQATVDTIAPVLSVSLSDQEVEQGTTINVPAAEVTDNVADGIVTEVVVKFSSETVEIVDGAFVADKEGTYTITYLATDKAGNKTEKVVYITVIATEDTTDTTNKFDELLNSFLAGCNGSVGGLSMLTVIGAAIVVLTKKRED